MDINYVVVKHGGFGELEHLMDKEVIRGLGEVGVVKDVLFYSSPVEPFSGYKEVEEQIINALGRETSIILFREGRIYRAGTGGNPGFPNPFKLPSYEYQGFPITDSNFTGTFFLLLLKRGIKPYVLFSTEPPSFSQVPVNIVEGPLSETTIAAIVTAVRKKKSFIPSLVIAQHQHVPLYVKKHISPAYVIPEPVFKAKESLIVNQIDVKLIVHYISHGNFRIKKLEKNSAVSSL